MAYTIWTQYGHHQLGIALEQLETSLIATIYECLTANVKPNFPQLQVTVQLVWLVLCLCLDVLLHQN